MEDEGIAPNKYTADQVGMGRKSHQRPYSPLSSRTSSRTHTENAAHRVLKVFNCDNLSGVSGLNVVIKILNIIFYHFLSHW